MEVYILADAAEDLAACYARVAEHQPAAAERLILQFEHLLERLALFPESGRRLDHSGDAVIDSRGYRLLGMPGFPFTAVHILRNERVEIIRILHGAQDLPSALT